MLLDPPFPICHLSSAIAHRFYDLTQSHNLALITCLYTLEHLAKPPQMSNISLSSMNFETFVFVFSDL
ncbi:hypothetical protein I3842_09G102600 [Carya illinoinensis]|uniref:Uncharacterized protein n=1 Tax=Carya illinoinensis TaxID=32201 RepID=A0A922E2Y5_CARIL|nr:hypothetical protein I3842_09G102600 [Carya illinoinensis]